MKWTLYKLHFDEAVRSMKVLNTAKAIIVASCIPQIQTQIDLEADPHDIYTQLKTRYGVSDARALEMA